MAAAGDRFGTYRTRFWPVFAGPEHARTRPSNRAGRTRSFCRLGPRARTLGRAARRHRGAGRLRGLLRYPVARFGARDSAQSSSTDQ